MQYILSCVGYFAALSALVLSLISVVKTAMELKGALAMMEPKETTSKPREVLKSSVMTKWVDVFLTSITENFSSTKTTRIRGYLIFAVMQIGKAYRSFLQALYAHYDQREARQLAGLAFEKVTTYSYTKLLLHQEEELLPGTVDELRRIKTALLSAVPWQYIVNEAWFAGMPFYVDKSVLIPRPETEELVGWVLENIQGDERVLDIGTGSGCIAIALKKKCPGLQIWAMDKSAAALKIAGKNARTRGTDIHFIEADITGGKWSDRLPLLDIVVSNPPYIPVGERSEMDKRVTGQEPAAALFVPDTDPLIFYKAILRSVDKRLRSGGRVFVEIHEQQGVAVKKLFSRYLQKVELKKDWSGKDRMVCGELASR